MPAFYSMARRVQAGSNGMAAGRFSLGAADLLHACPMKEPRRRRHRTA
jgi:hypothetical protein